MFIITNLGNGQSGVANQFQLFILYFVSLRMPQILHSSATWQHSSNSIGRRRDDKRCYCLFPAHLTLIVLACLPVSGTCWWVESLWKLFSSFVRTRQGFGRLITQFASTRVENKWINLCERLSAYNQLIGMEKGKITCTTRKKPDGTLEEWHIYIDINQWGLRQ